MIQSFASKIASDIYHGKNSRNSRKLPVKLHPKARRLLDQLNAAPSIDFLKVPPGNRLEKLIGNIEEKWSVRINNQWRVVFIWKGEDAHNVAIVDYH
ncbi:MAG: type II toxin-antitoxin system RelE/ParE family toxin [Desulfobulbaceae bacterium]|nr:type II toxin-antitoxin system RelE/ParE family toxin [Desulfobulbaceae bacterium]MCK5543693.1 type II toxin-antitoxin system RelE/ParE family toxin [Desulfobulbaceae bacterium]